MENMFINSNEYDEMRNPGRNVTRVIAQMYPFEANPMIGISSKLVDSVINDIKELRRQKNHGSKIDCISVAKDDGMSWSAEALYQEIKVNFPEYNIWCFGSSIRVGKLPAIAEYVGESRFLRTAVKFKLTSSFLVFRSWMTPLLILIMLMIGIVYRAMKLAIANTFSAKSTFDIFNDPSFYVLAFLLVASSLLTKFLLSKLETKTKSKSIQNFVEKFDENKSKIPFANFTDKIAEMMRNLDFPKVIIIDDYETLDPTSELVLNTYIKKYISDGYGLEYWIIFEHETGIRFSTHVLEDLRNDNYRKVKFFKQLPLRPFEKNELAKVVGKPERAEFSAVKWICHEHKSDSRVLNLLKEKKNLTDNHISRSAFNLLYLLSFSSHPGNINLPVSYILKNFTKKDLLRSEILRIALNGSNLTKNEFRNDLSYIFKKYEPFLLVSDKDDDKYFCCKAEVQNCLQEKWDELGLDTPQINHLFWAYYWYDKQQSTTIQPSLIKKLSSHLIQSFPLFLDKVDEKKHKIHILKIISFSIKTNLAICLFDNLKQLVECALEIIESEDFTEEIEDKHNLIREIWEIYSVIGDPDLLSYLVKVYMTLSVKIPEENEIDSLQKLFYQSLDIEAEIRKYLVASHVESKKRKYEIGINTSRYFEVMTGLFLSIIFPFNENCQAPLINNSYSLYRDVDLDLIEKSFLKINLNLGSVNAIDIITLSQAIWNSCLTFYNSLYIESAGINKIIDNQNRFYFLLSKIEEIFYLIAELQELSEAKSVITRNNYLMRGLTHELSGVCVAAIVLSSNALNIRNIPIEEKALSLIDDILTYCSELNDMALPKIKNINDLINYSMIKKNNDLFEMSRIVYKQFSMDNIGLSINIKRIHYNILLKKNLSNEYGTIQAYIKSIGTTINDKGYYGIVTNFLIAFGLRYSHELSSYQLLRTAENLIDSKISVGLKKTLLLMVLSHSIVINYNPEKLLAIILESDLNGKNYLSEYCNEVDIDIAQYCIIRLSNHIRDLSDEALVNSFVSTIEKYLESADKSSEGYVTIALLMQELDIERQSESYDNNLLLEKIDCWKTYRNNWVYASLLNIILSRNIYNDEIEKMCLEILDRDPLEDQAWSYFFLSLDFTCRLINKGRIDRIAIPLTYLKHKIPFVEPYLRCEHCIQAYEYLWEFDQENRTAYGSKIDYWHQTKLNRDNLEVIPQLVREGKYFNIFQEYVNIFRHYGIMPESAKAEFHKRQIMSLDERIETLSMWISEGATVPDALVLNNGKMNISLEFYYLGHILFSTDIDENENIHQYRVLFNEEAKRKMYLLMDIIINLESLPKTIKGLMYSYSKRFEDSSISYD